ncbi:MAG TPA: hypothetical protein VIO11_08230, partial [Candidatus Methanoperedens sp.]
AERTNKLSGFDRKNISRKQERNMELLLNHPMYSGMLNGSCCVSEAMVYYPYEPVKKVVKGNIAFLGDNAGMVHPVHGMGIHYINRIGAFCAKYCAKAAVDGTGILKEYQIAWDRMRKSDMDAWILGMTYWSLNIKHLNKIIEIRSNSCVDKMNVLSELRGHGGDSGKGDVFQVPMDLYLTLIWKILVYKLKYKLKYMY